MSDAPSDLQPVAEGPADLVPVDASGVAGATPSPGASQGPNWRNFYSGLDGLDDRLTPAQKQAFKNLDATTDNPKEARAAAINKTYYETQVKDLPSGSITGNWPAVRKSIAKNMFGLPGDIPDATLYDLTAKRMESMAFTETKEWTGGSAFDRFKQLMGAFPKNFGPTTKQTLSDMQKTPSGDTTFVHLPEASHDAPNIPMMGITNPALLHAIYNSAVKPAIEGIASPVGIGTLGLGGVLSGGAKVGVPLAKEAVVALNGAFAALMAKQTADAAPEAWKVQNDPTKTFQEKVEAWGATVTPGVMAVAGALGAVHTVRPDLLTKLKGDPIADAEVLRTEAAKAPLAESEHLENAAREFSSIAPEPPSDIAQGWDEVKRVFSPASRGPQAEVAAGALREHGADLAQRADIPAAALEDSSKALMKMDPEARWGMVNAIETGAEIFNPKMKDFAESTRDILDTKRDEIRALGTGKLDHFIADYFPHLWKDPEAAASAFQKATAKAPLEGSKSFLKQRTIPTIAEGMALGLEPATPNPVEMVLLKAREMDKYLLAQKWLEEMKSKGLVKFVRASEAAPEGYELINDKIATVYGKASHPGAMQIEGRYYAPSQVATVANNYLSPGLRKYASFRAYLTAANSLNQFQLGLSAFHLGFTSIDASISKLALGIEYGAQGKPIKAAAKVAQIPLAPITNLLEGNRVLKEWVRPGSQGADYMEMVEALRMAGGRAKMDSFYQTNITARMKQMFEQGGLKGNIGGLWRAPFAAMEQASRPIMEYIVPRQKLGVAADLIRMENERMSPNATLDEKRAIYAKAWDSVDNRMGQMVYDNLFWNKVAKDMAMASVRSVGWNLGTLRELGGGVMDIAKTAKDAMTHGVKPVVSHRMAYAVALPVMTGILGATYQYLKTGKGPDELRDYFFPKTGEKDPQGRDVRMAIPTYMKDVYHYAHDPVQTVQGKVHPALSLMAQMLTNKDYFGHDIRNADDPLMKQVIAEASEFAKQFTPIGIRQYQISQASGQTSTEKALNFVGVTRAPAWVSETSAEQLAGKLAGDKFKSSKSPDMEKVAVKQKIQTALRNGTPEQKEAAKAQLNEMVASQQITAQQAKNLTRGTDHTYLENAVSHLDAGEAMRVFKAASVEERRSIKEAVDLKIQRAHLPAEDKAAMRRQFEALLPTRNINTFYKK